MLSAFWTLLKLLVVTGLIIFLMEQDGSMTVEWNDYTIIVQLGMALAALLLLFVCVLTLYKIVLSIIHLPRFMRVYWGERSHRNSHTSLTKSLVCLAAGDYKHAAYHAHRAQKLLPDKYDPSAAIFIEAQAARLMKDDKRANTNFNHLLDRPNSAFLGIRGLMQTEIESKNYHSALNLAYSSNRMHPKQPWILKTIYDLEIQNSHWERALATLKKIEKLKVLPHEQTAKDRKAILVMLADHALGQKDTDQAKTYLKIAHKVDAGFVPAGIRLINIALEAGQKRKARLLIEKTWAKSSHPDLVKLWDMLAPENSQSKPTARFDWYQKLIPINPDDAQSYLTLAQIAIDDGLWGEARRFLEKAEARAQHSDIYLAWAELERLSTQNEDAIHAWMKKAQNAKQSKKWVCQTTNHVYDTWYAIAHPYGLFNTIEWAYPNNKRIDGDQTPLPVSEDNILLSPSA